MHRDFGLMLAVSIVVAVLFGSLQVYAEDGPALAGLRVKLPTPGIVMVDHEDPATLKPALAEGSSNEVVTSENGGQMPLAKAMRVNVGKAYDTPYAVQLFSADTLADLKQGDNVIMSCWVRALQSADGKKGTAAFYLQTTGPKWESPASVTTACDRNWKQVFAYGVASKDFPAGSLQVAIHIGQQQQVLEFAGLVVLNLGQVVDLRQLPRTPIHWRGMEANAPWRKEARKRIEKYRMAKISVLVVDNAGKPVKGVQVQVKQQKRVFTFGSFTGYELVDQTPAGQKMRETYLRLFNRATCPIYWADWGWPNQKTKYLAMAKWLADNHFTIRGHVMVYPTFNLMPADVVKLKDDPAKLRERILQQVREISEATKPFGFREYDVTNELRDCMDVHKLLGRDAVAEWYAEARKILPNAKLALNENTILSNGGSTQTQQDTYLDWYKFLKSKGQAPDVLGFQSHFSESVTPPETVWAILDRFARETKAEFQITEFDVSTYDEMAQADYTRDFYTVCFAHPRITGITMWGFWEGDHWLPNAASWRKDWSIKPNGAMLEELLTKTWWTNKTILTNAVGRAVVNAFLGDYEVTAVVNGRKIGSKVVLNQAGKTVALKIKL
jgi:endo-1,4-beta-xylanase